MSAPTQVPSTWRMYLRHFRPGRCAYCKRWGLWILRSESMHEHCWLELK